MSDINRLTDEQVAGLARGETYDAEGNSYKRTDHIARLAREVQQTRQRRCVNCTHYETDHEEWQWCPRITCHVTEDWFCADFTPK
jgi:hypothetical protein